MPDAEDHQPKLVIGSGSSTLADPVDAASQAVDQFRQSIADQSTRSSLNSIDLVIGFVTPPFAQRVGMIADVLRARLNPRHLLLVSSGVIAGDDYELGPSAAISIFGGCFPGVQVHPYMLDATWGAMDPAARANKIGATIGVNETMAASLFFADPYSVPMVNLVPALSESRIQYADPQGNTHRIGTVLGGLISGGNEPGNNTLFLDGQIRNYGAVGLTLSGNLQVDTVISQGCRPIGEPMVITRARGNLILELGGKPAIDAIRDSLQDLGETERELLENGLLIGRVINEQQARFGRGDFLIRKIMGGDEQSGALAVADLIQAGQTIQPHIHDAQTAREDLSLLLDAQRLYGRPAGAMIVSCTERTQTFFGSQAHDGRAIRHAFDPISDGAKLAKAGRELNAPDQGIPLAGMFGAGQIGPIGQSMFQHAHTLVAALFREPDEVNPDG